MLYVLITCAFVCFVFSFELIKTRYTYLSAILLVVFITSALFGTIIVCNSNFLSVTTYESTNIYQVTEFSAVDKNYNFMGKRITEYSFIADDNLSVKSISDNAHTKVICNNYKPTRVMIRENRYLKCWFLCPYDTYTYMFS